MQTEGSRAKRALHVDPEASGQTNIVPCDADRRCSTARRKRRPVDDVVTTNVMKFEDSKHALPNRETAQQPSYST